MINDYNKIHLEYKKTNLKPDKLYSMLPTILKISKPFKDKVALDVGCGDGFFTLAFSQNAKFVYGIDNSKKQIEEAQKHSKENIKFIHSDMLKYEYPKTDLIHASFILGYLKSKRELQNLFKKFFDSLSKGGKVVGIIDAPNSTFHNNKKFGSIKKLKSLNEGEEIIIELYDNNKKITTLRAFYHSPETIEEVLRNVGFKEINWHKPIISDEGIKKFGNQFWEDYLNNLDITYFEAIK